jgi:alcohol dehydrogenase
MRINPFSIARLPRIVFGAGSFNRVAELATMFGKHALLMTGAQSFRESRNWGQLMGGLRRHAIEWENITVAGEPSPQLVDDIVARFKDRNIDMVLGIGGGSVLDAAKAVAGLLPHGNSVLDHLEGVGRGIPYQGPATPFVAVPTTAGTGSEATKNAVLSVMGEEGYKKSFRDDALVPQYAIVDPELLATCPPAQIAANGMDALTQLLESYVSSKANPFTDALAVSGITAVRDGFFDAFSGGDSPAAKNGRTGMAYGSLLSGITLAQVGLGSVHGLASPLGAFFPIPHGVVCGSLVATATRVNIQAMQEREPANPALEKYARLGELLAGEDIADRQTARARLTGILTDWTERLALPRLGEYGPRETHIDKIVAHSRGSSMQTNPIVLTDDEIGQIIRERI